jgi:hypothetical protein
MGLHRWGEPNNKNPYVPLPRRLSQSRTIPPFLRHRPRRTTRRSRGSCLPMPRPPADPPGPARDACLRPPCPAPIPRNKQAREGAGLESGRPTERPTTTRAEPCRRCAARSAAASSADLRTRSQGVLTRISQLETARRCPNARAPPRYRELVRFRGMARPPVQGPAELPGGRLGDAARGGLPARARRCDSARPAVHPAAARTTPLHNAALRMRLSPLRSLTSLRFCCAGQVPTRGRELSGERPRTPI